MAKISIEEITPGMVLDSDLRGANGRFLLPGGTEIEEKHLRILKIWGVNEAEVRTEGAEPGSSQEEAPPELVAQAQELVDRLFSFSNPEFPPVAELKRLCLRKTVERLLNGFPVQDMGPPANCEALPEIKIKEQPFSCPDDLAGKEVELASFPDIYFQIMEVLNNPSSTASHVADLVSKDSSLTVKLLRLVNSAFYGFPSRVDSITRAVTLVGSNELSMLALGVSVVHYFDNVPPELMDMRAFWMHSIACGVFARILASHQVGLSEERFFLGGLIHDIGRLVILKNAPEHAAMTLRLACEKPCLLYEAEQSVLGFDHTAVASKLMRLWQFPRVLEDMVAFHHVPSQGHSALESSIVHCADILARSAGTGYKGLFYVPPLDPDAWSALGLSPNVVAPALNQAEHLITDIYNTFLDDSELP